MFKILAALSILNSTGASPCATEKAAALVARSTCSGASHSSGNCINVFYSHTEMAHFSKIRRNHRAEMKVFYINNYTHNCCKHCRTAAVRET